MGQTSSWRTVDIVVTAAIAVAFGVVIWGWNLLWAAAAPLFAALPPAQNLMYGVWLVPGVLAGLVVRKPGAAFFAEVLAAVVSLLLGSQWALDAALSGVFQGAGAELGFAIFRYRVWSASSALLAAALSAVGAWIHDMPLWYPDLGLTDQLIIGVFMLVSALVIAGYGAWWLMRALAETGVLAQLPSGRAQTRV
ncbi:MAG TPA: ECF transporter S component [Candidatus Limnocylindria bacterium]|nr:ECF transporter S component [Candidatus Limnocylindria bacterium]